MIRFCLKGESDYSETKFKLFTCPVLTTPFPPKQMLRLVHRLGVLPGERAYTATLCLTGTG